MNPFLRLTSNAREALVAAQLSPRTRFVQATKLVEALQQRSRLVKSLVLKSPLDETDLSEKRVSLRELVTGAFQEASRSRCPYVGSEHLYVSLLVSAGVSVEQIAQVREETHRSTFSPASEDDIPFGRFGDSLTRKALREELVCSDVRRDLVNKIIETLLRRDCANPLLVGKRGVGKTSLIYSLANRLVTAQVPEELLGKDLIKLDANNFSPEHLQSRNAIFVWEDLERWFPLGSDPTGLSTLLEGGTVLSIGTTTPEFFEQQGDLGSSFWQYFTPIEIHPPNFYETLEILKVGVEEYASHHHLTIPHSVLKESVRLVERYFPEESLPGAAVNLIDTAASKKRMCTDGVHNWRADLIRKAFLMRNRLSQALQKGEFQSAANLRERLKSMISEEKFLAVSAPKFPCGNYAGKMRELTTTALLETVSEELGVPIGQLSTGETADYKQLQKILMSRVIGQEGAVRDLTAALIRHRLGFRKDRRPIGSFLFLGPTGVGKTELAKALSDELPSGGGRWRGLVKLDMSEYREPHTISRLLGSPPGYVGYGEGGQLTAPVQANPYCVVCLDEIEKAHPDVLNILLQVMDEGVLTDAEGTKVDFSHAVIILTSNLGVDLIKQGPIGFSPGNQLPSRLLDRVKGYLSPEFLNRLDAILVFRQLDLENMQKIVDLRLSEVGERLSSQGTRLRVLKPARRWLAKHGYSDEYGARPLERLIERSLIDPIAERTLQTGKPPAEVRVEVREGGLEFEYS